MLDIWGLRTAEQLCRDLQACAVAGGCTRREAVRAAEAVADMLSLLVPGLEADSCRFLSVDRNGRAVCTVAGSVIEADTLTGLCLPSGAYLRCPAWDAGERASVVSVRGQRWTRPD